jgi:hypothetical protein
VLRIHQFNLGRALEANKDLPLGPGKEFEPPNVLHIFFCLHLLWSRMEAILTHGSFLPLMILDEDLRKQDLQDAHTFGNHKGISAKPESLQKLIGKIVVQLQHPHPDFLCNVNSRAVNGTNEHHGSEYN